MSALVPLLDLATWIPIVDGDPIASAMYERHYSAERSLERRRSRGALQIVGPCERLVLMTPCRQALFAWRRHRVRDDDQSGIECSIFRNEGAGLASALVRAADLIADRRWPGQRHFTFVDEDRVGGDPPGNCFLHAGWQFVLTVAGERKRTKERGLLILERSSA